MTAFKPVVGNWWIDDDPDRRVPGYIDLDTDASSFPWRLTVNGELQEVFEPGVDRTVTVFGETPLGRFTLERAGRRETRSGGGPGVMQVWGGSRLLKGGLKGGHIAREQVFAWATFQLPHLWHWLGPSTLNQHAADLPKRPKLKRGDDAEWIHSELASGLHLALGRTLSTSFEPAGWHENTRESASFSLHSETGFTADRLRIVQDGMAKLHSLVAGVLMEPTQIELGSDQDDPSAYWTVIPAGPPVGEEWHGTRDPFFDTADIDFDAFVREWLRLYEAAPIVASVVAPRSEKTYVTTLLTDVCNGAEALAAYRWGSGKGDLSAADVAVMEALVAQKIPSRTRRRVENLLLRDATLQSKLEALARDAGEESIRWLVGPDVPAWARLVVRLRNSLAHGSSLPNGLSDDIHFVVMAYETLSAVLRISLFKTCGYTNRMSKVNGEILWAEGRSVVGHPNSAFYQHVTFLASQSTYWAEWDRRLDQQ
ncbi:HEPN domain-containing protein [Promicromonospora sukumoe]|uniref:ApeA N-terminal domain 1-containing protein n=1 Tax=Promicromonospora sukumoe TaxID=88382 RepID=UPI0037CBA368